MVEPLNGGLPETDPLRASAAEADGLPSVRGACGTMREKPKARRRSRRQVHRNGIHPKPAMEQIIFHDVRDDQAPPLFGPRSPGR
jgi:hypothetical protein